ncbi:hypothetical protein EYC80_006256 [Monilinia laxa]|uniref:Uncharacterized protein n=1 Tax=Monilinia laxa TaxID=61186 RepID=A0A5N6KGM9_MONLA|nr:hypothetical protein EYC80_006256 [Monilinia laxa]
MLSEVDTIPVIPIPLKLELEIQACGVKGILYALLPLNVHFHPYLGYSLYSLSTTLCSQLHLIQNSTGELVS